MNGIKLFFKHAHKYQIVLSALLLSAAGSVCAQKQSVGQMEYILSNNISQMASVVEHPANSFVELDFSLTQAEFWDAKDKESNMIVNCFDGSIITGFETSNIVIQTVGQSYFSEAIIYFSDSQQESNGIEFAVGSGNNNSGVSVFSTDSILDITDLLGIPDIESLDDNKFFIQFYEFTDDIPNAIDARFTGGKLKIWGVDLQATSSCPFVATVLESNIAVSYTSDATRNVKVGDNLGLVITGNNNSDNTAINVVLENSLSESLEFKDFSCNNGYMTSDADALQSIAIGDVLANSTFICTMNVEVLSTRNMNATVTISSDNDSDLSNNSVTLLLMGAVQAVPLGNGFMLALLSFILIVSGIYYRKVD